MLLGRERRYVGDPCCHYDDDKNMGTSSTRSDDGNNAVREVSARFTFLNTLYPENSSLLLHHHFYCFVSCFHIPAGLDLPTTKSIHALCHLNAPALSVQGAVQPSLEL
jgi:hypothetical protein